MLFVELRLRSVGYKDMMSLALTLNGSTVDNGQHVAVSNLCTKDHAYFRSQWSPVSLPIAWCVLASTWAAHLLAITWGEGQCFAQHVLIFASLPNTTPIAIDIDNNRSTSKQKCTAFISACTMMNTDPEAPGTSGWELIRDEKISDMIWCCSRVHTGHQ
jgi:hypothetical protein